MGTEALLVAASLAASTIGTGAATGTLKKLTTTPEAPKIKLPAADQPVADQAAAKANDRLRLRARAFSANQNIQTSPLGLPGAPNVGVSTLTGR